MTYEETSVAQTINRLLEEGPSLDATTEGALDDLDQFHIGGAAAVDLLIPCLALAEHHVVLDVGSGFGGPARQIARRTGNRVVGVDITTEYVAAARELTRQAGLDDLVKFEHADITAVGAETQFQAAITMHVQMNVQDKVGWFSSIGRRLPPGGRLAVWEVCQPRPAELDWPMPWSLEGSDSFVVDPESLRTAIDLAGFTTLAWSDESAWVKAWIDDTFGDGPPAGPALPMLLDDGHTRLLNFIAALEQGVLQVRRGCFARN